MVERSDLIEIQRRLQNAAYEIVIADSEAETLGVPSRVREPIRTLAIKATDAVARIRRYLERRRP